MTPNKLQIITLMALCLLHFACSEVEEAEYAPKSRIGFQAVVAKPGSRVIEGNKYPETETFKSVAYYDNGNHIRANAPAWVPVSTIQHFNEPAPAHWGVVGSDGVEVAHYWPLVGSLTFMAYSPASLTDVTMNQDGITKEWNITGTEKDVDFMVADPKTEQTANGINGSYTGVPMVFRHMLTQVSFYAVKETDETAEIELASLTLHSVCQRASFKAGFTEGSTTWEDKFIYTWTKVPNETPADIEIYNDTEGKVLEVPATTEQATDETHLIGGPYLYIPQDLGIDQLMTVAYTVKPTAGEEQNYTRILRIDLGNDDFNWESGKHVKYVLTLSGLKPIKFEGHEELWQTEPEIGGVIN